MTLSSEGMRCRLLKPTRKGTFDELLIGECVVGLGLLSFLAAVSADGFSGVGMAAFVADSLP